MNAWPVGQRLLQRLSKENLGDLPIKGDSFTIKKAFDIMKEHLYASYLKLNIRARKEDKPEPVSAQLEPESTPQFAPARLAYEIMSHANTTLGESKTTDDKSLESSSIPTVVGVQSGETTHTLIHRRQKSNAGSHTTESGRRDEVSLHDVHGSGESTSKQQTADHRDPESNSASTSRNEVEEIDNHSRSIRKSSCSIRTPTSPESILGCLFDFGVYEDSFFDDMLQASRESNDAHHKLQIALSLRLDDLARTIQDFNNTHSQLLPFVQKIIRGQLIKCKEELADLTGELRIDQLMRWGENKLRRSIKVVSIYRLRLRVLMDMNPKYAFLKIKNSLACGQACFTHNTSLPKMQMLRLYCRYLLEYSR